jgi:hypothetical protein
MIPTIFGFPLWRGKIKRRVAKKYLTKWRQGWMLHAPQFAHLGVGDFVNDCSGQNGRILKCRPEYFPVGNRGATILSNVDFVTENTGCSLVGCGVEPKLSQEEIEKRMVDHHLNWTLSQGAKTWFGEGSPDYQKAVERANLIISTIESGSHVVDQDGRLLDQYKESRS